ncbi:hypothetical protein ACFX4N_24545 [Priestia sp. YIM B13551]|uniref:hypothetical protein n=1 Tax=Priestia sp. YIM B13551 TaxID=3366306 RepID=UPI00366AB5EF
MSNKMEYVFITCPHNIELPEGVNEEITLFEDVKISKDNLPLEDLLHDPEVMNYIGSHTVQTFEKNICAYAVNEIVIDELPAIERGVARLLTLHYLRQIQYFTHELWKVKDHNIYVRDGFLLYSLDGFHKFKFYKSSLAEVYSYADNRKETSLMTLDDMNRVSLGFKPGEISEDNNIEVSYGTSAKSHYFFKATGSTRMTRAAYFVNQARSCDIMLTKILHYSNALECLFTIGHAEISHKISERVALMLGSTEQARIDLYNLVKNTYKHRSTLVHGQHFKGTEETLNLAAISVQLDSLLRHLIQIDDPIFHASDKEMEEYFTNLLLKDRVPIA